MEIIPETNTVKVFGKSFRAMKVFIRQACLWKTYKNKTEEETHALAASAPNETDTHAGWKPLKKVVLGDHEIPQKSAMLIPVSVPRATVGYDICFDGPSKVKTLAHQSTLNTVLERNKTVVLVVNTTAIPVKLKQGVLLSHALAYDEQIVPEPLDLSRACIGAFDQNSSIASKESAPASLDSLVKVADYPQHVDSLFYVTTQI